MLKDRTVVGAGFQLIIASGSVTAKVREAILEGLKETSEEYRKRVIQNISMDDHTLEELRKLGHPYSVGLPEGSLHGDDRLVHMQTAKLRGSIRKSNPEETTSRRFSVYVTNDIPYLPFLIYGTSTMRPRRFHEKAFEEIKSTYWDPVLKRLRKVEHRISVNVRQVK